MKMSKYNVGEIVKFKSIDELGRVTRTIGGISWGDACFWVAGKEFEIARIEESSIATSGFEYFLKYRDGYEYGECGTFNHNWNFSEEMFERVSFEPKENDIIVDETGIKFRVIGNKRDGFCFEFREGCFVSDVSISRIMDETKYVYRQTHGHHLGSQQWANVLSEFCEIPKTFKLIYEKNVEELTLEEVCKRLGKTIKIVE